MILPQLTADGGISFSVAIVDLLTSPSRATAFAALNVISPRATQARGMDKRRAAGAL
jgi:hypothetical protein